VISRKNICVDSEMDLACLNYKSSYTTSSYFCGLFALLLFLDVQVDIGLFYKLVASSVET